MKLFVRIAVCTLAASFILPSFANGKLLTTKTGMTVYTFDKDTAGKSNCYDACAAAWPPVTAESINSSADITTITRKDGTKQAAYKNQPIYTYAADKNPGDKVGDGANGVWHVVTPGQAPAKKATGSSADGYY